MKILAIPATIAMFTIACGGSQNTQDNNTKPIASMPEQEQKDDIVNIAIGAGQFTTLVAALEAADLVSALKGDGPFTVFAPTDEAFAKLPSGTVEALLADKDKLVAVLTYHVVSGKVLAADVGGLDSATTLQGQELAIDTSEGVRIGNAGVVATDIMASNGVIHIIDTVLIPN